LALSTAAAAAAAMSLALKTRQFQAAWNFFSDVFKLMR